MARTDEQIASISKLWATDPYFTDMHNDLANVSSDDIRERFYRELEFGTAGIRGIMGAGTNRMNIHIVRRVSYAFAKYIVSLGKDAMNKGIVIGYDSRNNSELFAREAATQFASVGIKTYIHKTLCPVPVVSYSILELGTIAGIMVTASHNPKEYNGYKAYGPDGAQLDEEMSQKVSDIALAIEDIRNVPKYDFDALLSEGRISYVPDCIIDGYRKTIEALTPVRHTDSDIRIVYTPLHGAGAEFVPVALDKLGIKNLYTVSEQMKPDGNFPTCPKPNPENPDAYRLALELACKEDADIILATDPDSDRTGAYVRTVKGEYAMLTGNEIGTVLLNRRLEALRDNSLLRGNEFVVSTIVSTRLTRKICESYGVSYIDVLTGFKNIGEQINAREINGNEKFVFGFEESYGYLAGSYARDKDAVCSCFLLAEAAAFYKKQGKTLYDVLDEIYARFSAHKELQLSLDFPGERGQTVMDKLMSDVRALNGMVLDQKPVYYMDLLTDTKVTFGRCNKNKVEPSGFRKTNVLYYSYKDFWFCLRPSGTEPKIKIYVGHEGANRDIATMEAKNLLDTVAKSIQKLISD